MVDNTVLNTGSGGDTISTDDIAGVKVQRVKVQYGVDGVATDVSDTNPLPIDDAGGTLTVDNAGLTELAAAINASRVDVNIAASAATVTVDGSGVTQPVSGTITANAGTGTMTVDGSGVTQPISHANLGNLHSADFDTDVGTDTTPAIGIAVPAVGGAVVIPGDVTAGLKVDLGADNDVVVTGTVTANLGAIDNAVLDSIDTALAGTLTVGSHAVTNAGTFSVQISDTSFAVADGSALGEGILIQGDDGTDRKNINVDATTGNLQVDVINTIAVGSHAVTNAGVFAVQVDAALPAGTNAIGKLAANNGVDIGDVDVTSVTPGTGTTQLGKAIDAVAGASDVGVASLAIRDDALTALTPIDGDYVPLRVNSTGALHVTGGGGGTQFNVDDAAGATDAGTLALAIRDDALTTLTPIDGDYVSLRVNSTGALHVTGGGGGTEYSEDAISPAMIIGTASMMERDDIIVALTPIEGDWASFRCSAEGALWVQEFNSDAILADTASMDTNLGTIAGAVATGQMQVDLVDGNVTNAGTFAVQAAIDELPAAAALADNTANPTTTLIGACLQAFDGSAWDRVTIGGGVEATALRVTIANNSTGVIGISELSSAAALTDNFANPTTSQIGAMSMLWDGATWDRAPGSSVDGMLVNLGSNNDVSVSGTVTVDLGGNNDVTIDGSSIVHLEDVPHATGDAGVMTLAVRQDGDTSLVGLDGDYAPLLVNAIGALKVEIFDGGDTHAISHAALTELATAINASRVDVNIAASAATLTVDLAGNNDVTIDGSSVIKAEDTAAAPGDTGIPLLAVRRDADTTLVGADNDYANLQVNNNGALKVEIFDGGDTFGVVGNVAHDVAAAGNPVAIAARAAATIEGVTQVAGADASFISSDLNGCLVTRNGTTLEEIVTERVSNTNGTSTNFAGAFAAPGVGKHLYITEIAITNMHATTNGYVDFRDGSAGAIKWTMPAPAVGGSVLHFDPPLKFADNTAVAFDVSAAITTIYISINGYTAQG